MHMNFLKLAIFLSNKELLLVYINQPMSVLPVDPIRNNCEEHEETRQNYL